MATDLPPSGPGTDDPPPSPPPSPGTDGEPITLLELGEDLLAALLIQVGVPGIGTVATVCLLLAEAARREDVWFTTAMAQTSNS